jgi:fatty acid desaturase
MFCSICSLFYLPWALLPLGWALGGVALSHLYLIGHDCAHGYALRLL